MDDQLRPLQATKGGTFGNYLRNLRTEKQMTIRELQAKSQVSNAQISLIETGKRGTPKPVTIKKLARALDTEYEEMMKIAGY